MTDTNYTAERLLTPSDVAERFQVVERTVYEWLRSGDLVGAKIGSMWRIEETDVRNFIDRHRAQELMERVSLEFPGVDWVQGRCYVCSRPIPVPSGNDRYACGRSCSSVPAPTRSMDRALGLRT